MKILCSFGKNYSLPNHYTESLERAGAECVCAYAPTVGTDTDGYDGLLLTGGGDVDPALYGEENNGSAGIDRERNTAEIELIRRFAEAKKPIFGICRGMQILNVAFGGSLIQDLQTGVKHRAVGEETVTHTVRSEGGSLMRRIFGKETAVNTFHHQAVKKPGKGFRVTARSPIDGTAEAIEHTSLPIYAVQWHPERLTAEQKEMQELFDVFCRR